MTLFRTKEQILKNIYPKVFAHKTVDYWIKKTVGHRHPMTKIIYTVMKIKTKQALNIKPVKYVEDL